MTAKIVVTAAGLLLVAAVNWYFLRPRRSRRKKRSP
jgi:hypothetical protein